MPDGGPQSSEASEAGLLVLVVGPSGAGKDTLIAYAREKLAGRPSIMFPRRVVTRPAVEHLEDHDAVSEHDFERMSAQGRFAMEWAAHGLRYGVPAEIDHVIAGGGTVIVNVSRSVVAVARLRYAYVLPVCVTAPPEVLAARLARRGRESQAEIGRRLARSEPELGRDVIKLVNNGPVQDAGDALLAALADRLNAPTPAIAALSKVISSPTGGGS